ncbi:LLM class flavin-dependent oxidoreductase [Streptomyces sp. NPDC053750]|uniref:LLM class flavin-dependent oxidoreductase n=1 Tax=Streptomyces sp. NPDC053750 TaxID=3365714 RepID=UPI0037D25059
MQLADQVGLDYFGIGEHHQRAAPLSSPTALVNAAVSSTSRIKLSTAVSVLSTDDPIRVFQQLATAAAIAPGRIETVAGRGSSTITFPLVRAPRSVSTVPPPSAYCPWTPRRPRPTFAATRAARTPPAPPDGTR